MCPTSSKYAVGDIVYEGMIVGVTTSNSTINTCSGLGTCANQKCTCAVATEGMYAGLTMIRGDDCSDVSGQEAMMLTSTNTKQHKHIHDFNHDSQRSPPLLCIDIDVSGSS